jgi:magnesium-transporting ATPase (P-type)
MNSDDQSAPEKSHLPKALSNETAVQKAMKTVILVGFVAFFLAYFIYILNSMYAENWVFDTVSSQPAATMMLAFAALISLFVVLLLQFSTGPIRFSIPGFDFEGASGPIVLWVMCFLAVISAIKLLWIG